MILLGKLICLCNLQWKYINMLVLYCYFHFLPRSLPKSYLGIVVTNPNKLWSILEQDTNFSWSNQFLMDKIKPSLNQVTYTKTWQITSLPSFFFWAKMVTSSPLGRSSRNSTASSRMMFAKSTLFTWEGFEEKLLRIKKLLSKGD